LRQNFDKSDERNYKDGDKQSTRYFEIGSRRRREIGQQKNVRFKTYVTTDSLEK
jgi:hypothetical protein